MSFGASSSARKHGGSGGQWLRYMSARCENDAVAMNEPAARRQVQEAYECEMQCETAAV